MNLFFIQKYAIICYCKNKFFFSSNLASLCNFDMLAINLRAMAAKCQQHQYNKPRSRVAKKSIKVWEIKHMEFELRAFK